jgi:hypothetical protein
MAISEENELSFTNLDPSKEGEHTLAIKLVDVEGKSTVYHLKINITYVVEIEEQIFEEEQQSDEQ